MKKKIMIFMLLLSFLVGVGVPVQAKAANTPTSIPEDISASLDATLLEDHSSAAENFKYYVDIIFNWGDHITYWRFYSYEPVIFTNTGHYNPNYELTNASYLFSQIDRRIYRIGLDDYDGTSKDSFVRDWSIMQLNNSKESSLSFIVGANHSVCDENGIVIYNHYNFDSWCSDAGLNCSSSSNETEDLYYFEYDSDNWYVVRKNRIFGAKYAWFLSEFRRYGSDTWHLYSTVRSMAANNLGIADLSDELTMQTITVNNYVYDSTGGGWLFVDRPSFTLQVGDNYINDIGISFDSTLPIIYTNTSIYSDLNKSSVHIAAITEFQDVSSVEPTSTPTPTPISNSGSSDLGGNVVAGGGIDFIISIVSQLWSRVFSIPMYVDGFQINLQQIYVYGILAGVVGGAIVLFARRK